MYIAAGQGQTTPGDKVLMSTETFCHFDHLLQVFCYNIFHDFLHVYSPRAGTDNPFGAKKMSTGISCHFGHLLKVSKKSL